MAESRSIDYDHLFDAGEMGCGELVMKLKMNFAAMAGGECIKVIALDPGAKEDMPAWCKLTGHTLVWMEHPNYFIRKKEDS